MPEAWSARLATPAKILPLCRPRFRQWKPALHHTSKKQQGCQKGDLPTPPSTPRQSPPKIERPQIQIRSDVDPKGKKRTIEEIKVQKPFVYSWQPKKRPWSCHSNYSRHSRSLREQRRNSSDCAGRMFENDGKGRPRCSRNSEVSRWRNGGGKGARKAFEKLISEDLWNERGKCTRVPDWMYLLFKLKSRISDSGWQELTNLTKLGRTGVSYKMWIVIPYLTLWIFDRVIIVFPSY